MDINALFNNLFLGKTTSFLIVVVAFLIFHFLRKKSSEIIIQIDDIDLKKETKKAIFETMHSNIKDILQQIELDNEINKENERINFISKKLKELQYILEQKIYITNNPIYDYNELVSELKKEISSVWLDLNKYLLKY